MNKMYSSSPNRAYVAFTTLPAVRKFYIPSEYGNTIDYAWAVAKRFLEPGELVTACGPLENFAFLKDVQEAEFENELNPPGCQYSYLDILEEEAQIEDVRDCLEEDLAYGLDHHT